MLLVPPKAEKAEIETVHLAIVRARAEEVRDEYRSAGVEIRGEVFSADMTGERDADGRWPRVLAGFAEAPTTVKEAISPQGKNRTVLVPTRSPAPVLSSVR